ncbi:hypothetical protein [Bradyrhizobium sp. CCBAU 11361]|uniref:hypothetical protein n=1 Tax=Bradyrhizobium sp. CCBAU 11361 TaxID=1630812 RepID=UPI0023024160|nr:hypothetical protein [Bradyrhizobium sp. CCBAU 11361]MDA9489008.1 hypothetical protein [Bradyrhizobium sp. CCBAU 11361]
MAMTWSDDNFAAGDLAILFKISKTIRANNGAIGEARTPRHIYRGVAPICADDLIARRPVTERLEIGRKVKAAGGVRPMFASCTNIGRSEAHGTISFGEHSCSFADVVDAGRSRRARRPVAQWARGVGMCAADRRMSAELPPEDAAVASFRPCRGKGGVQTELMRPL